VLSFLTKRRIKKFTLEFANAIDVIVRSVKSGLPTNEALKIVAREMSPRLSGANSPSWCEGLKVGVTLEQGLKKMFESMPTAEVSFFGIVMTIQQKSGGNLSEALGNLAGVLRDRKRLQGKIKAMSSEAKASAMIIGSLPPVVGFLVWMSTPPTSNRCSPSAWEI
jgi:tight adherence protein B